MKILYIDCAMGAAGDMLTAALLELLPDPDAFLEELNCLGIPGVMVSRETSVKCGITGTHVRVTVDGEEEESHSVEHSHDHHHDHVHDHDHEHDHERDHHHEQEHDHEHDHSHSHQHSTVVDIESIINALALPEKVKRDIMGVYGLIAEAESIAHGKPVSQIHFHEVGSIDAVADITAVCMLIDRISPDKIIASPVCTGYGQVKCAHGILPVPAPATAYILRGVPLYAGNIECELCTPTGAALLKYFADGFDNMPVMAVERIGYGMGKKDLPAANCVRAMLGRADTVRRPAQGGEVTELAFNIDDMTAEDLSYACEKLFEGGAREVFSTPAMMKKSRMGTLVHVICDSDNVNSIVSIIFRHTSTIGIRRYGITRYTLDRREELITTADGSVRKKVSSGYGVVREKYEHDDLERIASLRGCSVSEVRRELDKNDTGDEQ